MGLPLAVTRRPAGAQGRSEPRTARLDGPGPQAGVAPRLARQVVQRQLDGGKTAAQRLGIDSVILLGSLCCRHRLRLAEQGNPGIETNIHETDAGLRPGASGRAAIGPVEALARIEQS